MQATLLESSPRIASRKTLYALVAAFAVIGVCVGAFAVIQAKPVENTQLLFTAGDLNPTAMYDLYTYWKLRYNKLYSSEEEDQAKFQTFQNNYLFILNFNADPTQTSTVGLNEYADLTTAEFSALKSCLGSSAIKPSGQVVELSEVDVPTSVDWTTKGAVTPIKDQGQCGSCWAFSTTGSLEGLNFVKSGTLTSFSEQQLVDCSGSYGNQGCNGGLMDYAFEYVESSGITTESAYPYEGVDQTCQAFTSVFKNTGYSDVTPNTPAQLLAAIAQQPVSVAIEADQSVFQLYTGGVISSSSCGTNLDHGVLAVGYDTTASTPYYKVKNSWGSSWGESGYVRIKYSKTKNAGICGIQSLPSYPTL